jgi:hypothetical protein
MGQFLKAMTISLLTLIVGVSHAELVPGARYFIGNVKVFMSEPSKCFVETVYSADLAQVTVRSIKTLPHLSAEGALTWIAVGPYAADYVAAKSLYRYKDAATAAPVKDMVLNTTNQTTPHQYAILYWHAQAGHHDPIKCEELIESVTVEQLAEVEQAFAEFENLKAQN